MRLSMMISMMAPYILSRKEYEMESNIYHAALLFMASIMVFITKSGHLAIFGKAT